MPASENIRQLVKCFEDNRESYRSGKYNETQLRREFLDPFFEALGWDLFNKQGYAEDHASRGEGECAVFMKLKVQTQITVVPPPLSHLVFDNGGGVPLLGRRGSDVGPAQAKSTHAAGAGDGQARDRVNG